MQILLSGSPVQGLRDEMHKFAEACTGSSYHGNGEKCSPGNMGIDKSGESGFQDT